MEFTGEINDSDIEDIAQGVVEDYDFTYIIQAALDYDEIARYVEGEIDVTSQVEDAINDARLVDEEDVQRIVEQALDNQAPDDDVTSLLRRVKTLENALRALADVVKPNPTVTTTYPIVGG